MNTAKKIFYPTVLALIIILLISILSFNPMDSQYFTDNPTPKDSKINVLGNFGVAISSYLFLWLGNAIYFLIPLSITLFILSFPQKYRIITKGQILGQVLLIFAFAMMVSLFNPNPKSIIRPGGLVGDVLANSIKSGIGSIGAYIVLSILVIISLSSIIRFNIFSKSTYYKIKEQSGYFVKWFKSRFKSKKNTMSEIKDEKNDEEQSGTNTNIETNKEESISNNKNSLFNNYSTSENSKIFSDYLENENNQKTIVNETPIIMDAVDDLRKDKNVYEEKEVNNKTYDIKNFDPYSAITKNHDVKVKVETGNSNPKNSYDFNFISSLKNSKNNKIDFNFLQSITNKNTNRFSSYTKQKDELPEIIKNEIKKENIEIKNEIKNLYENLTKIKHDLEQDHKARTDIEIPEDEFCKEEDLNKEKCGQDDKNHNNEEIIRGTQKKQTTGEQQESLYTTIEDDAFENNNLQSDDIYTKELDIFDEDEDTENDDEVDEYVAEYLEKHQNDSENQQEMEIEQTEEILEKEKTNVIDNQDIHKEVVVTNQNDISKDDSQEDINNTSKQKINIIPDENDIAINQAKSYSEETHKKLETQKPKDKQSTKKEVLANLIFEDAFADDTESFSNHPDLKNDFSHFRVTKFEEEEHTEDTSELVNKLMKTLNEFKIEAKITGVSRGPVITRFEIQPAPGIMLSKIVRLSDNISMSLGGVKIRIIAPIPGKSAVGIEVPNKVRSMVRLGDVFVSEEFKQSKTHLPIVLGKDISGKIKIKDLVNMPHLLIAGSTNSGKSVCVNSILCSLLYSKDKENVKFILVDPKVVELKVYNDLPHLLTPVITEPKKAAQALNWLVKEMERRYKLLESYSSKNIINYNRKIKKLKQHNIETDEPLNYIILIIDEFADLMMVAKKEVESNVSRLAAMARAVGIHLIIATQRPSTDIITGVIKANFPARIGFMVASYYDSKTILDNPGAEKLLGKGDMLFFTPGLGSPVRIQGTFVSEEEIIRAMDNIRKTGKPEYIDGIFEDESDDDNDDNETLDEPLYKEAIEIVVNDQKASASYLQRKLKIGYNRAARIVEYMEKEGIVGPEQGSKPREVLIDNY